MGEFRAGLATLRDPEVIDDAVDEGVRERAPEESVRYVSFVDAASGSGKDSFTVAVAHKDAERAVLDVLRAWKPPCNPSGVIAEASDLLKRYRSRETSGDRYAPGFVAEHFHANGIRYNPSQRDRYVTERDRFLPVCQPLAKQRRSPGPSRLAAWRQRRAREEQTDDRSEDREREADQHDDG